VPTAGTTESLRAITRDDMVDWHRQKVLSGASVIGVVAGGDADAIAGVVAGAFPDIRLAPKPELPRPAWPHQILEVVERRARAQSAVAMLFPGPTRVDPDRYAVSLIGGIASGLGGRFFDELRDRRSLCYTVATYLSERWRAGAFVSYIATSPEKEAVARDALLEEFRKLREGGVTAEELHRARTYAIGAHQIRMQSGASVLGEVVDCWLFGTLAELDESEARLNAVTRDDIQRAAQRYFDPAVRVEAIVRGEK
jgi:zinc protease